MEKVLLIEDDPLYRRALIYSLQNEPYQFIEASSPQHGISIVKADPEIRVVVLDLSFPFVTGTAIDFLDYIEGRTGEYRIVVLTAHDYLLGADEAGKEGIFAYLPKADTSSGQAIRFALRAAFKDLHDSAVPTIPIRGGPIRLFLSYENSDRPTVTRIYEKLAACGLVPWMDHKNLRAGEKWEPEIYKAIEEVDYFVFFLSSRSIVRQGTLRREVNRALARQKREKRPFLIPVRLEDCDVVAPFKKFQHVDFFRKEGFEKLLRAISLSRS